MRSWLDDNTRSALHYLAIGGALAGVARLIGWIAARSGDDDPLRPFQGGYLLLPRNAMVLTMEGPLSRMLRALFIAFLTAALVGVLIRSLRGGWSPARLIARWVFLLFGAWGTVAAMVSPARMTWPDAEGAWHFMDRARYSGDLWVPFLGRSRTTSAPDALEVVAEVGRDPDLPCGYAGRLLLRTAEDMVLLGTIHPTPPVCDTSEISEQTQRAAQHLMGSPGH